MIDFVGQSSPVSRWRLLGLDALFLALQVLMLGLTREKQKILAMTTSEVSGTSNGAQALQDHDAEEAGLLRSDLDMGENIEMQAFSVSPRDHTDEDERGQRNVAFDGAEDRDGEDSLDNHYTGEHMVANLDIFETIRTQWQIRSINMNTTTATGVQTAATIAGRRFTVSFGGRGRDRGQS